MKKIINIIYEVKIEKSVGISDYYIDEDNCIPEISKNAIDAFDNNIRNLIEIKGKKILFYVPYKHKIYIIDIDSTCKNYEIIENDDFYGNYDIYYHNIVFISEENLINLYSKYSSYDVELRSRNILILENEIGMEENGETKDIIFIKEINSFIFVFKYKSLSIFVNKFK